MLREFFTRAGIRRFLSRIRVGGFSVNETLRDDSRNTQAAFLNMFRQAVRADMPVETAIREFGAVARSRRNHALRKLKNIMVMVLDDEELTMVRVGGRLDKILSAALAYSKDEVFDQDSEFVTESDARASY